MRRKPGKERIRTQQMDDDPNSSNQKYGEDRTVPKRQKTVDNEENRVPPSNKNRRKMRRTTRERYTEVRAFDDTDRVALFNLKDWRKP